MTTVLERLRQPPPFTDTSERNLMSAAADEIERQSARIVALERERDRLRIGLSSIVNFQSPLTRSQVREAAADILRECTLKVEPQDNQSPLAARIAALTERNAALEKELAEAKEQIAKAQEDEWEKWSIEFEGDAEVLGEIIRRQARKISNYYHRFKYQSKAFATITAERDKAYNYAVDFLTCFVDKYCNPVPNFEPLPDLLGVLTQIDNATTVIRDLTAERDKAVKALEPFAAIYSKYDRDDEPITVLGKHLRFARATLDGIREAWKDNG